MSICKATEILSSEAYPRLRGDMLIIVAASLPPRKRGKDEGNTADGRFSTACQVRP
jgi:hypothetical protein